MTSPSDGAPPNIDPKSRIISDIFNHRYNKNVLSDVKTRLDQVKKTHAAQGAVDDGELVGIALFFNYMNFAAFAKKYENNISFFREITSKGKTKGDYVREVFVHIPEITGMLPYPNFVIINNYLINTREPTAANTGAQDATEIACEKELKKITMFPRFYEIVNAAGHAIPTGNSACLVKSLRKEGLPSEVLGKFIKVLQPRKL